MFQCKITQSCLSTSSIKWSLSPPGSAGTGGGRRPSQTPELGLLGTERWAFCRLFPVGILCSLICFRSLQGSELASWKPQRDTHISCRGSGEGNSPKETLARPLLAPGAGRGGRPGLVSMPLPARTGSTGIALVVMQEEALAFGQNFCG